MPRTAMPRTAAAIAALWILTAPGYAFAQAGNQTPPTQTADRAAAEPVDEPATPAATLAAVPAPERQEPRPGFLRRRIDAFFSDGEGIGLHLGPFVPGIESVSSGSGLGPMLHFWTPNIGGSPFDIHASAAYSINRYQYYDFQAGLLPHVGKHLPRIERGTSAIFPLSDLEKTSGGPGFSIYASARYRNYPREVFYGLGPSSLRLDRSDYRRKEGLYEGVVSLRVARISLMGRAGVFQTEILPGDDSLFPNTEISFSEATAPGLFSTPANFMHVSGGAWLELRDEPLNPHRGISIGAAVSRFDDRGGSAFQFNRVSVDLREYIPLGSNRSVIALRQLTTLDDPDAGSKVPFYMQSTLGRSTFLRGYSSFRFRDDKLLAFEAEYRFEVVPKVELALLYDTGKVFHTIGDFDLRDLRRSWGAGIRLKSPKKVKLRLDVMRSGSEGTRVQVKLDQSF